MPLSCASTCPPELRPPGAWALASQGTRPSTSQSRDRHCQLRATRQRRAVRSCRAAAVWHELPCPRVSCPGEPTRRILRRLCRRHLCGVELAKPAESVIDRKIHNENGTEGAKALPKVDLGLGELARFKVVQSQLPDSALARLFVDPRQFERLLAASPPPSKPSDVQIMPMLIRYLASLDYAGLALTWNERAISIHSAETLNPSLLDAWLRHWAGDARPLDAELMQVPSTALGLASGHFDGIALLDALSQLVPASDQPKLTNIQTVLSGLLLGQDLNTQILTRLGPSVLAYFDTPREEEEQGTTPAKSQPPSGWLFPLVTVVSLGSDRRPARPLQSCRLPSTTLCEQCWL